MTVHDLFFYVDQILKIEGSSLESTIKIPPEHPVAFKPFMEVDSAEFTFHDGSKLKLSVVDGSWKVVE
jgi:hypothetical protein